MIIYEQIGYNRKELTEREIATLPKWISIDGESQEAVYIFGRNTQELCVSPRLNKSELSKKIAGAKFTDGTKVFVQLVNK